MPERPASDQVETADAANEPLAMDDVFCVSCGSVIARDARHCTECGAPQPVGEETSQPGSADPEVLGVGQEYCSDCGAVVDVGTPFCGTCGTPQDDGAANSRSPSDWIIGFGPGISVQNVAAGVFFYLFLYPVGMPTLVYGYLSRKRRWETRPAAAVAVATGLAVLALIYL